MELNTAGDPSGVTPPPSAYGRITPGLRATVAELFAALKSGQALSAVVLEGSSHLAFYPHGGDPNRLVLFAFTDTERAAIAQVPPHLFGAANLETLTFRVMQHPNAVGVVVNSGSDDIFIDRSNLLSLRQTGQGSVSVIRTTTYLRPASSSPEMSITTEAATTSQSIQLQPLLDELSDEAIRHPAIGLLWMTYEIENGSPVLLWIADASELDETTHATFQAILDRHTEVPFPMRFLVHPGGNPTEAGVMPFYTRGA